MLPLSVSQSGWQSNASSCQASVYNITMGWMTLDSSNTKMLDTVPRIGDAINFDESYLSAVEIKEITEARKERASGRSRLFSEVETAIEWLHSEQD